ncbi:MFS transporter [Limosilactobacillus pontis]|uniref:Transporter, major facilitator family protein n=1 Tax=Limosilactobacillus pontis DSM 8475 TaxID=1423794 RepID=A0A922TKT3_9LACO|nr:MFS transporter [Limosilactobacillus pontis]KRM37519.1 transporter, major facilitator family protein [Limosilactobacillus pontis DSM 8475]QFV01004.1 MFS transporter [Limosilactobacillus pontis]
MKYRLQSIVFVLTAFLLGCNEFMVVGVISNIAKSYHASLSTVGLLVTFFAITYAVCTPVLTTVTSKYNRFKVLMAMLVIFWIGNTMTALAPNLFWLFVARIITAAVAGVIISLILVFVSVIAPLAKRSMLVAAVFSGFSTATIIGVPVGTTISMLSSWYISFLVISVLTIIIGAALYWLVPRDSDQVTGSIKSQLRLMGDRRIVLGVVVMIALMAAEYTFYTYIRPIITDVLGYSTAQLNWLLGLIGVMFILGNTAAGIVSSHYGIAKMPQVSAACLILLLVMGLAFHLSWMGIALLCLICFVLGMPGSILQVMFLNVADRDYPEAISLASSLNPICTNVGVSVGSLVASISVNFVPISQVGYIGAIFALIGVVGTMMLVKIK